MLPVLCVFDSIISPPPPTLLSFNQDGSIFDSELFDVPLSYSKMLPRPPISSSSSSSSISASFSVTYADYIDFLSNNSAAEFPPHSTETTPTSHTSKPTSLYDPEFLLLLHGEEGVRMKDTGEGSSDKKDGKKDCSVFKEGLHLLSSQRGLLETIPLRYSCSSLSAGLSVRPPPDNPKASDAKPDPLLSAYLNIHQPLNQYGYLYPARQTQDHALPILATPISHTSPLPTAPPSLPKVLSHIPDSPEELFVTIDSLKPGSAHSVIIDFSEMIRLTDILIQSNPSLSSVSVTGWCRQEESESIKLVQSTDLGSRMVAVGNLAPPPVVRYVRLRFVGATNASSERCVISLGQYYGKPLLPCNPSLLLGLEAKLHSQYLHQVRELKDLLVMFNRGNSLPLLRKQFRKHLLAVHQRCFEAQVKLSRVRNQISEISDTGSGLDADTDTVIKNEEINETESEINTDLVANEESMKQREEEKTIDYNSLPLKKLTKCTSCITNTLLLLSNKLHPPTAHSFDTMRMGKEECRQVFLSVCVNDSQSVQSRVCALLVRLCGSEEWWGELLAELFYELFNDKQTILFDKQRYGEREREGGREGRRGGEEIGERGKEKCICKNN